MKKLLFALLLILLVAAPFLLGAITFEIFLPAEILFIPVCLFALYSKFKFSKRLAAVMVSVAVTVAFADVLMRLVRPVPDALVRRMPALPVLTRYLPNLDVEGQRYSDLAQMTGDNSLVEPKRIRLITDASGFRNDRVNGDAPLDVILLGDSFTAGAVSHEDLWSSVLMHEHQLRTYNLGAPGAGPWTEYVNLLVEKDRLKTRQGTLVVWQLFSGNDLDEYYGPLPVDQVPWNGWWDRFLNQVNSVRSRSPLLRLTHPISQSEEVVTYEFLNKRRLLFHKPYIQASTMSVDQILHHPVYQQLKATIGTVKRFVHSQGWRLAMVAAPSKEEVYAWVWQRQPPWSTPAEASSFSTILQRICNEEDIPYLDLKPPLVIESRHAYENGGELLYWYDDTHLNRLGSRYSADVIYEKFLKDSAGRPIGTP
jgi:lysophospholipase L1-like esterase